MKTKDLFELSVTNIKHRKLRAWLTLLGIIIGVMALVSIMSLGSGMSASVSSRLSDFGTDIITMSAGFSRASGPDMFRGGPPGGFGGGSSDEDTPELTKKDLLVLKKNSNVKSVMESVSDSFEIEFLSESLSSQVTAINPLNWDDFYNYDFDSGRKLSVSDAYAVVIGYNIANERFDEPITIGRKIMIEEKSFTVVGILKEGESDNAILIPMDAVWSLTDKEKDIYSQLQAKLVDESLTEDTITQLEDALRISRKVKEGEEDFTITSPLQMQEQIESVTSTMTTFLAAIAAVSLIVGAVGVANSMFTSVMEQTKEIGILKALGATNGEVLKLFMIESALFGLVGGIIGVLFGVIGSGVLGLIVGNMAGSAMGGGFGSMTLVTPQLVIFAITLSTLIGLFSGILPARAASKLKPIDALRYE